MKRAFVFIDGGNFYFKLKNLTSRLDDKYSLLDFNFRKFAERKMVSTLFFDKISQSQKLREI